MTNPLVSILLPVYNGANYLEECIESLINQSYNNIEIIIMNDGSTDQSLPIAQNYAQQDSRIKVHNNIVNINLTKNLNKGLEFCTGEYIARMDQDDIAYANRITKQLEYFNNNEWGNLDLISTKMKMKSSKTLSTSSKYLNRFEPENINPIAIPYILCFQNIISHPSIMARKEVLKQKYNEQDQYLHCEDTELWLRLSKKGYKIAIMDEKLIIKRDHGKNLSVKYNAQQIENAAQVRFDYALHFYGENIHEKNFKKLIYCQIKNDEEKTVTHSVLHQLNPHLKNVFREKAFTKQVKANILYYYNRMRISYTLNLMHRQLGFKKINYFGTLIKLLLKFHLNKI